MVGERLGRLMLAAGHEDASIVLRAAIDAYTKIGATDKARELAALLDPGDND